MEIRDGSGCTLLPKLLHPQSYGSIKLKSQNPFEYPPIDPRYLSNEQDVEVLLNGKNKKVEGITAHLKAEIHTCTNCS